LRTEVPDRIEGIVHRNSARVPPKQPLTTQ
jgi:hypothetical protein